jgi:hypothetical protein
MHPFIHTCPYAACYARSKPTSPVTARPRRPTSLRHTPRVERQATQRGTTNGALSLQRSDTAPPIPRTGGDGSMIAPLRHPCVTCARRLLAARRPSKMPARPRERLLRESARPSNTTYSTPHTCSLDHDQKPPDAAIMVKEPEVRRAPPKVPPNWSCRRELSLTPAFSYVV